MNQAQSDLIRSMPDIHCYAIMFSAVKRHDETLRNFISIYGSTFCVMYHFDSLVARLYELRPANVLETVLIKNFLICGS